MTAGSAAAANLCVGSSVLCPVSAYSANAAGVQTALNAAKDVSHPGPDKVYLSATTFNVASTLNYTDATNQDLQIIGSGIGQTIVKPSAAGVNTFDLSLTNTGGNSSISNLSVQPFQPQTTAVTGIVMRGGVIENVDISMSGSGAASAYGATLYNNGSIKNTTFHLTTDYAQAVYANTDTQITGMTVIGDLAFSTYGFNGSGGSNYSITRSSFKNLFNSVSLDSGTMSLSNSVIDMSTYDGARGVLAVNGNMPPASYKPTVLGSNVTLVGTGNNQVGVTASINGSGTAKADLSNSIVMASGTASHDFSCGQANSATVAVSVAYSIFNPASSLTSNCTIAQAHNLSSQTTPPAFVNAAAGNFRPTAGSPVIDSGDPATVAAGGAVDFYGQSRFVNSTGTCEARVDIGAAEFQTAVAPVCPVAPAPPVEPDPPAPTVSLSGSTKKAFVLNGKGFAAGTSKSSPRITITASAATTATLTLFKVKGGYKSGTKCVAKQPKSGKPKKCDLQIKGTVSVVVKSGVQDFVFGGKWNKTKLKAGSYKLYAAVGSSTSTGKALSIKLAKPKQKQ